MSISVPRIYHRHIDLDGVRMFYRESVPARDHAPTLLLLHGFPSGSHQFRRLFDVLGSRYRLIAPDYPGFGHTETPKGFSYTFDAVAAAVESFISALDVKRFSLYLFDFGAPVGFRVAMRNTQKISGLILQNANAYEVGLSPLARDFIALRPDQDGAEKQIRELLTLHATRHQYEDGTVDPRLIPPEGWTLDQHFLDQPGRKDAQVSLAFDYKTNVAAYPEWQQWLREKAPRTLITWGKNDAFFPASGARAYLSDLPDAHLHLLESGHFALEDQLHYVAPLIADFLDRQALKIAVMGASGRLGSAVADEAEDRGHHVTRLRSKDADVRVPHDVAAAVAGHDVVIASIKGGDGVVTRGAESLIAGLSSAGVRQLVFVGGGGSLMYEPGKRFIDSPAFPTEYLETATDQADALELLRRSDTPVRWTYVSPPPVNLFVGEKTGQYRSQVRETPLVDESGNSQISISDYAVAVVDTAEKDAFSGARITVAY